MDNWTMKDLTVFIMLMLRLWLYCTWVCFLHLWSWHLPWPPIKGRSILVNTRNRRKSFRPLLPESANSWSCDHTVISTWCYDVMTPGKLVLLGHFVDIDREISYSVLVWMMVFIPALARSAHQSIPLNLISLSVASCITPRCLLTWQYTIFFFSPAQVHQANKNN